MKYLFLFLMSVFTLNASAFDNFNYIDQSRHKIIRANLEAVKMIRAYSNHPKIRTSDYFRISNEIINQLTTNVTFYYEKETGEHDTCKTAWGFASRNFPGMIFLCKHIDRFYNDINKIAQIIIHESFHLWEYDNNLPSNEINAGEFEADVTMIALDCIPYKSGRALEAIRVKNKRNARFCDNTNYEAQIMN